LKITLALKPRCFLIQFSVQSSWYLQNEPMETIWLKLFHRQPSSMQQHRVLAMIHLQLRISHWLMIKITNTTIPKPLIKVGIINKSICCSKYSKKSYICARSRLIWLKRTGGSRKSMRKLREGKKRLTLVWRKRYSSCCKKTLK
jgi:hypothetical protein